MIRIILIMLCLMATAQADDAPTSSLFFTNEEVKSIQTLTASRHNHGSGDGDIHLDAILYYGANDWTVWMQGMRWTPATEHQDIQILDVAPTNIRIHSAAAARDIVLKPHQTYQISTGQIIESDQ